MQFSTCNNLHNDWSSFRSIFIWKPREDDELKHERDESRIILCGKGENSRKRKHDDDSGDDDDVRFSKKKKTFVKSRVNGGKRK